MDFNTGFSKFVEFLITKNRIPFKRAIDQDEQLLYKWISTIDYKNLNDKQIAAFEMIKGWQQIVIYFDIQHLRDGETLDQEWLKFFTRIFESEFVPGGLLTKMQKRINMKRILESKLDKKQNHPEKYPNPEKIKKIEDEIKKNALTNDDLKILEWEKQVRKSRFEIDEIEFNKQSSAKELMLSKQITTSTVSAINSSASSTSSQTEIVQVKNNTISIIDKLLTYKHICLYKLYWIYQLKNTIEARYKNRAEYCPLEEGWLEDQRSCGILAKWQKELINKMPDFTKSMKSNDHNSGDISFSNR
jgi:hypothetical protein